MRFETHHAIFLLPSVRQLVQNRQLVFVQPSISLLQSGKEHRQGSSVV